MGEWYPVRVKLRHEAGAHRHRSGPNCPNGKPLRGTVVRVRPVDFVEKPFPCRPEVTVEVHHDDIRSICGFDPVPGRQYLMCDHQFQAD
jgi:hypothetical protein